MFQIYKLVQIETYIINKIYEKKKWHSNMIMNIIIVFYINA